MTTTLGEVCYQFGQFSISWRQVFFNSRLCLGIVNIMPAVPGHVLVIPRRNVLRFKDLSAEEVSDLFLSAQTIAKVIEPAFKSTSMTLAVQDGTEAGMTVHHFHIHVMPRKVGDFPRPDDVYHEIERPRVRRTMEEMEKEAAWLSGFFSSENRGDAYQLTHSKP